MFTMVWVLIVIMCLKGSLSIEARLILQNTEINGFKASPNGIMFAISNDIVGLVVIYDWQGNILTSRTDHTQVVCSIQWLDNDQGPITFSRSGRIAIWNGLEGEPTILETGRKRPQFGSPGPACTGWKVSDNEQYFAFNNQTHIFEWDIIKQVETGIYSSIQTSKIGYMTYAENRTYLVVQGWSGFSQQTSNLTYFDTNTKLPVWNVFPDNTIYSFGLSASKTVDRIAVSIGNPNNTKTFVVKQYTQGSQIHSLAIEFGIAVAYCGDSKIVTGGMNSLGVYDFQQNYELVDNITGVQQTAWIDCAGNYVYALNFNQQVYVATIQNQNADTLPPWVIVTIVAVSLIVVAGVIGSICIKQKLGITVYQLFKMWRKRKQNPLDEVITQDTPETESRIEKQSSKNSSVQSKGAISNQTERNIQKVTTKRKPSF